MTDVVIWGVGKRGKWLSEIIRNCRIVAYIDVDDSLNEYQGISVLRPEELGSLSYDTVIVSPISNKSIYDYIHDECLEIDKFIFLYFSSFVDWHFWMGQFWKLEGFISDNELREILSKQSISLNLYNPSAYLSELFEDYKECVQHGKKMGYMQLYNYDDTDYLISDPEIPIWDDYNNAYYYIFRHKRFYYPKSMGYKKTLLFHRDLMIRECEELLEIKKNEMKEGVKILGVGVDGALFVIKNFSYIKSAQILVSSNEWFEAMQMIFENDKHIDVIQDWDSIRGPFDYAKMNLENDKWIAEQCIKKSVARNVEMIAYHHQLQLKAYDILITNGYSVRTDGRYVFMPEEDDNFRNVFKRSIILGQLCRKSI